MGQRDLFESKDKGWKRVSFTFEVRAEDTAALLQAIQNAVYQTIHEHGRTRRSSFGVGPAMTDAERKPTGSSGQDP